MSEGVIAFYLLGFFFVLEDVRIHLFWASPLNWCNFNMYLCKTGPSVYNQYLDVEVLKIVTSMFMRWHLYVKAAERCPFLFVHMHFYKITARSVCAGKYMGTSHVLIHCFTKDFAVSRILCKILGQ